VQFDPFASPFRPAPARHEPSRSDDASGRSQLDGRALASKTDSRIDFRQAVAAFERQLLEDALATHRHNQRATAAALGLSYDQLRNQLRKHGLLPGRRQTP
jgi:psp operon transcriptional activator